MTPPFFPDDTSSANEQNSDQSDPVTLETILRQMIANEFLPSVSDALSGLADKQAELKSNVSDLQESVKTLLQSNASVEEFESAVENDKRKNMSNKLEIGDNGTMSNDSRILNTTQYFQLLGAIVGTVLAAVLSVMAIVVPLMTQNIDNKINELDKRYELRQTQTEKALQDHQAIYEKYIDAKLDNKHP